MELIDTEASPEQAYTIEVKRSEKTTSSGTIRDPRIYRNLERS
jgi:hypothetical protein